MTKNQNEEPEFRTYKDILKDIAKEYNELGKLLYELERMIK